MARKFAAMKEREEREGPRRGGRGGRGGRGRGGGSRYGNDHWSGGEKFGDFSGSSFALV